MEQDQLNTLLEAAEQLSRKELREREQFGAAIEVIVAGYIRAVESEYASRCIPPLRDKISQVIERIHAVSGNEKALMRIALGIEAYEASEEARSDDSDGRIPLRFDIVQKPARAAKSALYRLESDLARIGRIIDFIPKAKRVPVDTPEQELVLALAQLWAIGFGEVPRQPLRRIVGGPSGAFSEWLKLVGASLGGDAGRKRLDEIWLRLVRSKSRQK
jgi:hypothetical protein